jgi:hypothetical protein
VNGAVSRRSTNAAGTLRRGVCGEQRETEDQESTEWAPIPHRVSV